MSSSVHSKAQAGIVLEGKYHLEHELGAGGMGQVFLARHETLERHVAIKVLHQNLAGDDAVRRRFETEAKAIARLRHPNCVMLYEFGYSEEIEALFAVFEYVQGTSLESFIGQQLPIADVILLGQQVADGIAHAHEQKIIHRDLKPENIMVVATDGDPPQVEIKVLDFGIARIAEDDEKRTRLTQMGQMFGTPPYMSPEQIRAKLNVTFATDIYSIGVILYEMLEGQLPFLGDTPIETVMMHLNEEVPPLKRDDIPQDLVDIVMRCLEKDAEDRFDSCRALSEALQDIEFETTTPSAFHTTLDGGVSEPRDMDSELALKPTVTPADAMEGRDAGEKTPVSESEQELGKAHTILAYDSENLSEGDEDGEDEDRPAKITEASQESITETDDPVDDGSHGDGEAEISAAKRQRADEYGEDENLDAFVFADDDGKKKLVGVVAAVIVLLALGTAAILSLPSDDAIDEDVEALALEESDEEDRADSPEDGEIVDGHNEFEELDEELAAHLDGDEDLDEDASTDEESESEEDRRAPTPNRSGSSTTGTATPSSATGQQRREPREEQPSTRTAETAAEEEEQKEDDSTEQEDDTATSGPGSIRFQPRDRRSDREQDEDDPTTDEPEGIRFRSRD